MFDDMHDNQSFIDDAKARGLDTLAYHDPKSREFLLVAGHPYSIRLLGEIIDDYEMVCAVVEAMDTELLERWRVTPGEGVPLPRAETPLEAENYRPYRDNAK